MKAIKEVKLGKVCFKCLGEFEDLHKIKIPMMGWGSQFDNESTEVHLCSGCYKLSNPKWWELKEVCDDNEWGGCAYEFESEILNFAKTFPLQGKELFENRFSKGACAYNMEPQDWIDYSLDILPHEKCKEYGLYSPEEIKAYKERFPKCGNVKVVIYDDGSSHSKCYMGAYGNKDKTCGINISGNCYNCKEFKGDSDYE